MRYRVLFYFHFVINFSPETQLLENTCIDFDDFFVGKLNFMRRVYKTTFFEKFTSGPKISTSGFKVYPGVFSEIIWCK